MADNFNTSDHPGATDGDPRAEAVGNLILADDGTNLQTIQCTTAGVLKVDGTATTQPVSSTQLPAALVGGRFDINIGALTGVIDTNNSTTTPLAANGTFTGTATDLLNYAEVSIQILANVASALNGISIQTSQDGTTWNLPHSTYSAAPLSTLSLTLKPRGRYWRLFYTNGSTIQATFRVQAILRPIASGLQSIGQDPGGLEPGIVVRNIPGSSIQTVQVTTQLTLTPNSPTAASVGVASGTALATNTSRKGLVLTNRSTATISIAFGVSAVLNSGITLDPGDVFVMDQFTFSTAQVNAIAGAAASSLAIQEFQ